MNRKPLHTDLRKVHEEMVKFVPRWERRSYRLQMVEDFVNPSPRFPILYRKHKDLLVFMGNRAESEIEAMIAEIP